MAFLTIVINTASESVAQLNQLQPDQTLPKFELNQLIDYLAACSAGNKVIQGLYVVTNNSDPAVATDGGSSAKIVYTPSL